MPGKIDARTVVGVPVLPPPRVTAAATWARDRVGRALRRTTPPPVQIVEAALSLLDHRVLVALCRAGVPDALTGPTAVADLAARLGVDASRLERLLRFAAAKGWVSLGRDGRVRPTAVTRFLRSDHPGGWRSWVDFAGIEEVGAAVDHLGLSVEDPFVTANGTPFFDWMADHPDEWATFDRAMAAGGRLHALTLDAAVDWGDVSSVCDVGGGTGALLATLLDRHPGWRGAVLDLAGVVARAVEHPRLEAVAGDAFVEVPAGFDAYLLVNVLHDWGDDDCVRILRTVAAAAGAGGRVLVVDSLRRDRPLDEIGLRADVLMAALTGGGKERDADGFAALGRAAGLRLIRTTPLASGDVVHELVSS